MFKNLIKPISVAVTNKVLDLLFIAPIALLPHHLLSRVIHRITRSTNRTISQFLISKVCRAYNIDLSIAKESDPKQYLSFNLFFTRQLKIDARPITATIDAVISPVDGAVSQCGKIHKESILQAKGHNFSLTTLLGGVAERATQFNNGLFSTIYLSPKDYHRIHMPLDGTLKEMVYIPGRLYPVNNPSARTVPGLFARNERVAVIFDTEAGPMAMVLVGALFVGSIETVWAGEITPPQRGFVHYWRYSGDSALTLKKGEEMGRFNMGSTVILLFGESAVKFKQELKTGAELKMGKQIGTMQPL